jgi:hypothetical protein
LTQNQPANNEQNRPNVPQQQQQPNQFNNGQPNMVNIIGGFLQPGTGSEFNFANLFAPQRAPQRPNQ